MNEDLLVVLYCGCLLRNGLMNELLCTTMLLEKVAGYGSMMKQPVLSVSLTADR